MQGGGVRIGSSDLRAGLPLLVGRGGVHGGGVRIGSSVSKIRAGLPLPLLAG